MKKRGKSHQDTSSYNLHFHSGLRYTSLTDKNVSFLHDVHTHVMTITASGGLSLPSFIRKYFKDWGGLLMIPLSWLV